jgi:carbohydrate kinase (thermoresistant glucokinase family)
MIVIVMGVTGSGKTTVGSLLAAQLAWKFADADDFHPVSNIEKMRAGIPLTDDDRWPWLKRLRSEIDCWIADGRNVVLACSALKRSYREELDAGTAVRFVYLKGSVALITERLRSRHGHFADEHILAGQFADLEEPDLEEPDLEGPQHTITVDISGTPQEIVAEIRQKLGLA